MTFILFVLAVYVNGWLKKQVCLSILGGCTKNIEKSDKENRHVVLRCTLNGTQITGSREILTRMARDKEATHAV